MTFHSFENRNLSNLLGIGDSCKFGQLKEAFLRGDLINLHFVIKPSKSLILRVSQDPPPFLTPL